MNGAARWRLPDGETRRRKNTRRMVQQWHASPRRMVEQWHVETDRLGREGLDSQEVEELLYKLAKHLHSHDPTKQGVVADVARLIGGSMVALPIDSVQIQRSFGDLKGFGAVDDLVMTVTGGVAVSAVASEADLERALRTLHDGRAHAVSYGRQFPFPRRPCQRVCGSCYTARRSAAILLLQPVLSLLPLLPAGRVCCCCGGGGGGGSGGSACGCCCCWATVPAPWLCANEQMDHSQRRPRHE